MATDVKGINIEGIGEMQSAVEKYISAVNKKVEDIGVKTTTLQKAVKGTATETTVKNMYAEMKSAIDTVVKQLSTFASDNLATVKASYQKADASNTSFSDVTKSINS